MDSTPETLVLASLIVLYFVLSFAELYLRIRRARNFRQWRRQQLQQRRQQLQQRQQQEEEEKVVPPPPEPAAPLQTPAPDQAAAEEPANEGGRETQPQQQRRRRRARKKRQQQDGAEGEGGGGRNTAAASPKAAGKGEPLLPQRPQFPLASVAGALQRRIHERYDDLVRASEARCLTIEQVNEFVSCLIEARNELLQRYENVQRSFKIKKAMLSNHQNYRSSYGRLFEQVCRLEIERDNLKKDADIYNCLQERLQESAPYKLIMDLSALELEAPEMSFEELLAKEKEDTAFWQPNGKMRSASSK